MFEFEENLAINAKIKVIGVGGGGGNSIKTMMKERIDGVDFIAINTDIQALKQNDAMVKIQIGSKLTKGLGSGSNPQIGRDAAIEDEAFICEALEGSDMVFVTAGMGGGTGTGAAPVIGKVAKELGILTVGVVTKPFSFEGKKRMRQAEEGINDLKQNVDTLICLPNDNLLGIAGKDTAIVDSFKMVDSVVLQAVRGISDLITIPGLINLDFADIKTIMKDSGLALMGTGVAGGEDRAIKAAKAAISSPLLENVSISGATGIVLNITGTSAMTLFEVNAASKLIQQECDEEVNIIFGTVIDDSMGDDIRVTVIATGFGKQMSHLKQQVVEESQNPGYREWFNAASKPKETAVQRPAATPPSIRDVFNEMKDNPVAKIAADEPMPTDLFDTGNHQRTPTEQTLARTHDPQKTPAWGGTLPSDKDHSGSNITITRKKMGDAQDHTDVRRVMQENEFGDTDNEEYEIPAFIRRRAD